jgi:L-malate glycosyltransferase
MRICFISTGGGFPWGGSEELWSAAARAALGQGHRVAAVTYRWPDIPPRLRQLRACGARLFRRSRGPQHRPRRAFERFVYPWPALLAWGPDVVCISQGSTYEAAYSGIVGRFLRNCGAPHVIVCQHNCDDAAVIGDGARRAAVTYFRGARQVAFVAERNLRSAERQLADDLPNARIVRNPVNLADLSPVAWPGPGVTRMASVARLDTQFKGQDVLLEVLGGASWRGRPWALRFYGDGPDRPYLERLARRCAIAERVEFRGHVPDIRSIWADNHLLVMPSRSEGTPLSLVEAMLCGRPAVVTDVGGHLEWIDEPATGFVADAPTPRSWGAALERAWEARPSWAAMGRRAHDSAISRIDPDPGESLLELLV